MATLAVIPRASVEDLIGLFTGCEFSAPCPSVKLAVELCRRLRPKSSGELRRRVLGDYPVDAVPKAEREALVEGYTRWAKDEGFLFPQ